MRVPGCSLVLLLFACVAHAQGPACAGLLKMRFDRPTQTPVEEFARARAEGRLRLEGDDQTIAIDPETGAPDRFTYELARRLEIESSSLGLMPRAARSLARRLIAAKRVAFDRAWADPHYRVLSRIRYTEPVANGYVDRPVRDFIVDQRFRHPFWWETFADFARFEDFADGRPPGPPARITAQTSRSPLAYLFGRSAERVIFWPSVRDAAGIRPELSRIGINETRVDGRSEAIELLVNAEVGAPPQGYIFMNFAGELVPTLKFNGQPVAMACARCHASALGATRTAFQPFFLRSGDEMLKVGYRGERIIRALLER